MSGKQSPSRGPGHDRPQGGGPGFGFGRGHGMGMPVQKPKNFKTTFRRLTGYFRPHAASLAIVFATAVLSTVFSIVGPKIMGEATTALFKGMLDRKTGIDFGFIGHILLILAGLYVISSLFSYLQQYVMAGVAQRIVYDLRESVNRKLARLPLQYFDARTHGETLSRVTNDIETIGTTLQQSLTQFITSIVTLVGVLVMMLSINWLMTLIVLITLPLSAMFIGTVTKRSQKYFRKMQQTLGQLNGHVEEMYTGHMVVKAFGREDDSIARFRRMNDELYDASWRSQFISGIIMPIMNVISNLGYVLVCIAGGIFVMRGTITIGDVQAFLSYSRQFSMPITQTAQIANVIQSTVAAAERVFELLDEPEETPDSELASLAGKPRGEVRFEDVSFGYKADEPLIEHMNINVASGQTIAIVGPTGAGKTTLVNLLMRFYDIQQGRITVDGRNIAEYKRGDLRSIFGMVLQDTWLFNGTIRDNIAYGRQGASEEEIVAASEAAYADHFIRTLPDGYDTVLNEEATNLSQGQKQLLTIARAILSDPAILILDEATSSVDTRTEAHIQQAMQELMRGRTSFVIAHRLSTIQGADLILVMNHGSIIEQGTHEQLLAKQGFYAELYHSQFTGRRSRKAV